DLPWTPDPKVMGPFATLLRLLPDPAPGQAVPVAQLDPFDDAQKLLLGPESANFSVFGAENALPVTALRVSGNDVRGPAAIAVGGSETSGALFVLGDPRLPGNLTMAT